MTDNGGPAFPRTRDDLHGVQCGMTLRDYFAAQAVSSMATRWQSQYGPEGIAHHCYQIADAMLAEREKATSP